MKHSLRTKLTLSYIFIVIVITGITVLVANMGIQTGFQRYAIQKQEKQVHEIIELIQMKYKEEGDWNPSYLEIIGMNALQNGMTVVVKDNKDVKIWSAYEHNNGLCQAMILNMAANMASYSNKWSGEYQENTYDIQINNESIGTLTTGFVGPYYFNDEELIFIKALNTLFVVIGITSLVLAFTIGIFMSVRIARPLDRIAKKALGLAEGKYKVRLNNDSNTKEIGILTDTINQLSDALENKDKLRKQLTQDVAHELRTPLTSVQGHMEAMIDGVWEMNVERLSSCYEEIIRIKKLIGSIEDLSGAENENLMLIREEFDFTCLVKRLLNNYHNELRRKDIAVEYDELEHMIYGDQDKMSQILNNLLSNSIKYSKEKTKITITCKSDPKTVTISVKDTGIGIKESDLPYIFERFYRADKSRSKNTGGVGIGLTITKAIVNAHGGEIEAKSEYGKGTEFIITLPNNAVRK